MSGRPTPATVFGPRGQVEPEQPVPPPARPSMGPTPIDAQCAPAGLCRIYLGALCYSTRRLTLSEAEFVAATVRKSIFNGDPLIDFPAVHHEQVWVRSSEIRAIEVVRADALQRPRPNPSPGRVAS